MKRTYVSYYKIIFRIQCYLNGYHDLQMKIKSVKWIALHRYRTKSIYLSIMASRKCQKLILDERATEMHSIK